MIINSDTIIPIETHFKVTAGPGAGKTYWLVEHIKNVLATSDRLQKSRKIACITYTNIAADTLQQRLGIGAQHIEVSTIHSFLYNNVVKPFCGFLDDEIGINPQKIKGHDDPIISSRKLNFWLDSNFPEGTLRHPFTLNQLKNIPLNRQALRNWIESIHFELVDDVIHLVGHNKKAWAKDEATGSDIRINNSILKKLESVLFEYKKLYWAEGRIDHEDVLYLSHLLICTYPFILDVLRAKYPYFFIDEFQDTNPIQNYIIKKIAEKETIVGVIGDNAQAIYEFQGADVSQFICFELPNLESYEILNNRRSTNKIVTLLNYMRHDLTQTAYRNEEGITPTLLVGDSTAAYSIAKNLCQNALLYTLSRDNITSNSLRVYDNTEGGHAIMKIFKENESNTRRYKIILDFICATEYAITKNYKDALKKILYYFVDGENEYSAKKAALHILSILTTHYMQYRNRPLLEFYHLINTNTNLGMATFRNGKAKTFYDTYTYDEMAICVNTFDTISTHKTIHKAKGDEFDNVFIILKDGKYLIEPDLNLEEHRVLYVGISRARNNLFINIPTLNNLDANLLKAYFNVINISANDEAAELESTPLKNKLITLDLSC